MFVLDDNGRARRVRDAVDLDKINRETLKVFDDNGKMIAKKMSKAAFKNKMFGR